MDDNERFAAMDKQMKKSKEAEIRASEREKMEAEFQAKKHEIYTDGYMDGMQEKPKYKHTQLGHCLIQREAEASVKLDRNQTWSEDDKPEKPIKKVQLGHCLKRWDKKKVKP